MKTLIKTSSKKTGRTTRHGVDLTTDGTGSYFKPAEVHVKSGDVVRFNLKVGVHNIHFLADSNAGRTGYPQSASDFSSCRGRPSTYWSTCPRARTTSSATRMPRSV